MEISEKFRKSGKFQKKSGKCKTNFFSLFNYHMSNKEKVHGSNCSKYQVTKFLRGLYYLFKDSPARRAEYFAVSGSNVFPKKFCQIRWLENVQCVERALVIFENVKKYIDSKPKLPAVVSVKSVQESLQNPLMLSQMAFFKLIAEEFHPFLARFQDAAPLSPYLYTAILTLTQSLLRRCVKKEVIDEANTAKKLAAINLDDKENLLSFHNVDIGFSAAKYLNKSKVSEKEKGYFKMECRKFMLAAVSKIFERSPLLYSLTRGLSGLVPEIIIKNPSKAQQRMDICLKILHDANRINDAIAERAKKEFLMFCDLAMTEKDSFLEFKPEKQRLDIFYANLLSKEKKYENVWKVIKLLLILSHGNATVEGGFSINKSMLIENLHEESVVAQRRVYDYVTSVNGINNVQIGEQMLQSVKGSRTRWGYALEEKKKKDEELKKAALCRKRQKEKISDLKSKKLKISETAASELESIDSEIANEENVLRTML